MPPPPQLGEQNNNYLQQLLEYQTMVKNLSNDKSRNYLFI